MSLVNSKFAQAIRAATCPLCGSPPPKYCIRRDGRVAASCHNERLRAAGFGDPTLPGGPRHGN